MSAVALQCLPGQCIWVRVGPWLFHPGRRVHLEFQGLDSSCAELPADEEWPATSPIALFPCCHSPPAPGSHRVSLGRVWKPAHPSPACGGNISLRQPRVCSHKEESKSQFDTTSPRRQSAEPEGGLRQMQRKQVHPSFLCFSIHSTNICWGPGRFPRAWRERLGR